MGWGSKRCNGGVEFHPPRERGRWARRLPHLPATFEGEPQRRTGCFIAEVRLRGGHRGFHSKGISVHIVVGWVETHLLLAVSGFSVAQVAYCNAAHTHCCSKTDGRIVKRDKQGY